MLNTSVVNALGRARFLLRLALWLAGFVVVVLAWGGYNSWPVELAISLSFLPLKLVLAWWLYRRNDFGFETKPEVSQWELLIGFLLLAIGIASGMILLMAVAWVSIGVVLLRPVRRNLAWDEWFKLPLIFLLALPVWLDVAGSRYDWVGRFQGIEIAPAGLEKMVLVRFQVLVEITVLLLACFLRQAIFWLSLPLAAAVFYFSGRLSQHFVLMNSPVWWPALVWLTAGFIWMALACLALRGWLARPPWTALWTELTQWAISRTQSTWLVSLVILLQQSALVDRWLAGVEPRFDFLGAGLLLALLWWMRWRRETGAVRVQSRLLLAAALFMLLGAEWTDLNPLRQASLGLLVISLFCWRQSWSWKLIGASLFAWITLIPAFALILSQVGLPYPAVQLVRAALLGLGLVGVMAAGRQPTGPRAVSSYSDFAWQPVKRFAFILLVLLLGFQTVSAFWPEPRQAKPPGPAVNRSGRLEANRARFYERQGWVDAHQWSWQWQQHSMTLIMAHPVAQPIRISAPERLFQGQGWRVLRRRLIPHARGQAVEVELRRGQETRVALYWFDQGDRAFANYQQARRILWSGWNLTRRELRLVVLQARSSAGSSHLTPFAQSQDWFRNMVW
ncbi:MAG: exosortase-associated EpsI family protein [Verrucomicrobiota bacterium]